MSVVKEIKKQHRYLFKGDEKRFEKYIYNDLSDICNNLGYADIKKAEMQHVIKTANYKIIPDIMIWHKDGTGTIFEVKVTNSNNPQTSPNEQIKSIGQLLLYRSVIKEKYGEFPRVFLITDQLFEKTFHIFADNDLPVGLIEIQNDRVFVAKK